MASVISAIAGVVTATNVILTRFLEVGDRRYTTQENQTEWKKFAKSYQTFADGIPPYELAINSALSSESFLSNLDKEELNKLLTALDNITTETKSELTDLESRLNPESITTGSASTEQKKSGKKWLSRFKKVTKHPAFRHAQRDEKKINKLKENLEKANENLKEGKKLIEDKFGIFNPYFKNYYRGNNICLDYDNGEQENASHEAKLKHTLLHPPSNIGSSTQHSFIPRAVCVEGQGGMGKTTILKDICTDEDMRKKFYDGIHFMTIGEGADDEQVKKEICRSLRNAGFGAVVAKIREDDSIEDLASKASKIFQGRSMMLVVDDWHPEHTKYLKTFENMLYESKEGVLLVSSRYQQIGIRYERVLFKELEPTGLTSRTILLKQLRDDSPHEDSDKELQEAIQKVLIACGGIKLCLAIAGSTILLQSRSTRNGGGNAAIVQYSRDLERTSDQLLRKEGDDYKDTFSNIIEVSLGYCNKEMEGIGWKDLKGEKKSCTEAIELFKGFCVFEKQRTIPIHAISRLWDVEKDCTTDVTRIMGYCSLLSMDDIEGVEIHDKVLDVARILAEKSGKECVREFHERILRGYVLLLKDWDDGGGARRRIVDGMNEEEERKKRMSGNECDDMDWEVFNYPKKWKLGEEAEYFVCNVCRHLEEGRKVKELWKLLTNVWWTLRRRKIGGLIGLMSDFERLKRVCEGGKVEADMEELFNREEWKGIGILMNQVRDGWMGILEDDHMIGFEIFGRVLKEDRRYEIVEAYLRSIEEEGPRPWLRPLTAGLGRVDGRQIGEIRARHGDHTRVCVSSDCGFVLFKSRKGLEVIDIETHERWKVEGEEGDDLRCTSMCSQHQRVACGWSSGKVSVWDVEKGEEACDPLTGHQWSVRCVAMSGDGNRVVSGGEDGTIRVWDVEKGKEVCKPLTGNPWSILCVVMSGDGNRVVSGGEDGSVQVWDVEKGEEECTFRGHDKRVECVAVSSDWSEAVSYEVDSGGGDSSVDYSGEGDSGGGGSSADYSGGGDSSEEDSGGGGSSEEDSGGGDSSEEDSGGGDSGGGDSGGGDSSEEDSGGGDSGGGDYSEEDSGGEDGSVPIWDVEMGEEKCTFREYNNSGVTCVGMSGDGNRVVSGGRDGIVRVWDVEKGEEACDPLTEHDGPVGCVVISEDGNRVVSGADDGSVRVWDVEKGQEACDLLTGHDGRVWCVVMNGEGNRVVSGGVDGSVRVWDLEKGEACDPVTGHDGEVLCVVMSGDGNRVVSGGSDGSVRVWDVEKGELACDPFAGHQWLVSCVATSGDGNRVVSGAGDGSVRVWDVEKGQEACDPLAGHYGEVEYVVMSGDGNRVVSGGSDGNVRVWDVEKGEEACDLLTGHDGDVECVVMSGDGNRVVSGGWDESVRVWDVEKGQEACDPLTGHDGEVLCVVMSGDGNRVVSGGRDGSIRVWDVERGLQLSRHFKWKTAMEDEYNSWLTSIQSSITNQDGGNESSICMKSLHQDNIAVLEQIGVSIASDSVCCDCSACERICERDKCSVDKRATAMWFENKYMYVNLKKDVKVGRKDKYCRWCVKNGGKIAIGLKNGRVMICRLQM